MSGSPPRAHFTFPLTLSLSKGAAPFFGGLLGPAGAPPPPLRHRYPELDVMKAAAIVAVVLIHSMHPFYARDIPPLERVIGEATRFAVPAFLAVSGFLYYSAVPIAPATIGRRLRRILVPYVCVSVLAFAYDLVCPWRAGTESFVGGMLFGAMFGPYYYIFVLTEFVGVTWVLSRLPGAVVWMGFVFAVVAAVLSETHVWMPHDLFWIARNPALWAVWFLMGWIAAAQRDRLLPCVSRYRAHILVGWVTVFVAWTVASWTAVLPESRRGVVAWAMIFLNLAGLFALRRGEHETSRATRTLSDWTYAIYLLHPFFVYAVDDLARPRFGLAPGLVTPLSWLAGLLGPLVTTALMRRVFGARSRDLIGA